ncbi:MAG: TolB family protein [Solirubrobacterales bacterium]
MSSCGELNRQRQSLVAQMSCMPRPALRAAASLVLAGAIVCACLGSAAQAACTREQLRAQEVYALRLPDCRAYEQVTPTEKDATNPGVARNAVQASLDGDAIVFFVKANMPNAEGASTVPLFLASRVGEGWLGPKGLGPEGLLPPSPSGVKDFVLGWSPDLSQVALLAHLAGDPEGSVNLYLRASATGSDRLAVPNVGDAFLAGFSADDTHLIFETSEQLLPAAAPGVSNLYELDLTDDSLGLAGVLPESEGGSAPTGGSFAGPYEYAVAPANPNIGGASREYYTLGAISENGSRVVFTAGGTGRIYVREPDATPSKTIAVSPGTAEWRATSSDGRYVFYTEAERLYRFDVETESREELAGAGAAVQGTLGIASDGSYAYFVANGVLAANEGARASHATLGNCVGIEGSDETCNLYVWNASGPPSERTSFIAPLNANALNGHRGDANNWFPLVANGGGRTSRVSRDGKTLLFLSHLQLSGYLNTDANTGQPDDELYLYDATRPISSENPTCVSCNPSGAAPIASSTLLSGTEPFEPPRVSQQTLTNNLSADGGRVFFETKEALLPGDTNGVQDVYEWERAGVGGCQAPSEAFSESAGGCLYLISTGRSPDASFFADASADGNDAFLLTDQPLVSQDQDQLLDVYDARVDGGIEAQNQSPSTPCAGEECRGATSSSPLFGAPSSSTFVGPGNPPLPVTPARSAPKPPTRAQKLARALKACAKKPRRERAACVRRAKARYGTRSKPKARKGDRRGKRR